MGKSALDLVQIVRNVTGRVDPSDPQFTNEIMIQYLQDFIQLQSTQDVRLFKNYTWWEFEQGVSVPPVLVSDVDPYPNPLPVDLQALGYSTIGPIAYADGFQMAWYQNPAEFYAIWPEFHTYQPQRPTGVLYYNNTLTFRGPPDITYDIKISAYQVEIEIDPTTGLNQDYLYRYLCYGTALDIFSDFGEMDKWREIYPAYQRYRALVYSRTYSQYQNQRPMPEF